jgi:hypothetical protein
MEHPVAVALGLDARAYVTAPEPEPPVVVKVTVKAVPLKAVEVVGITSVACVLRPAAVTFCGVDVAGP